MPGYRYSSYRFRSKSCLSKNKAAIFGVQIEGPARRKLDNGYYDIPIPAASIDLNFICVDDGDIECALGRGRCGRRGVSNVIKGSITASGLGALFAREYM